ncbi:uncharacterized protein LOC133815504 [Humulus lupulus]|uniref:uncharacterized protein LOC133815504 n=1 Tax=Humulus lupulus TaxID=3486 RepID=UPI002B40BDDB|nr:uncharacterized protein LOC133815504 [Humulus lupulus]
MVAYLNKAKDLLAQFEKYTLQQVPHDQKSNVDALAKLVSAKDADALSILPVEHLLAPSIQPEESSLIIQVSDTWVTPIIQYLEQGLIPADRNNARTLQRQAAQFILMMESCIDEDTQCLYYGVSLRKRLKN